MWFFTFSCGWQPQNSAKENGRRHISMTWTYRISFERIAFSFCCFLLFLNNANVYIKFHTEKCRNVLSLASKTVLYFETNLSQQMIMLARWIWMWNWSFGSRQTAHFSNANALRIWIWAFRVKYYMTLARSVCYCFCFHFISFSLLFFSMFIVWYLLCH